MEMFQVEKFCMCMSSYLECIYKWRRKTYSVQNVEEFLEIRCSCLEEHLWGHWQRCKQNSNFSVFRFVFSFPISVAKWSCATFLSFLKDIYHGTLCNRIYCIPDSFLKKFFYFSYPLDNWFELNGCSFSAAHSMTTLWLFV